MIRIDITDRWPELRSNPAALQRFVLDTYGADRVEMAMFPYTALLSADDQQLGMANTYGYPRITVEGERVWLELSDLLLAFGPSDRAAVRDRLAALAHEQWSGWMRYLFEKSKRGAGGNVTIPRQSAERWTRQMETPFADLSDEEKASDRVEADRVLALLEQL